MIIIVRLSLKNILNLNKVFSSKNMIENNGGITGNNDDFDKGPSFIVTESSQILLGSIEDILADLISRVDLCPADYEFYDKFRCILDLYDRFQREVIDASKISIVCSAGCSSCCCHWVDDVNSFEGMIISRYLADNHPDIINSVIKSFRKDAEALTSLQVLIDEKIAEYSNVSDDIPDNHELLLSCFYQLERPCALLDDSGRCLVYPVRPLTCRDYLNLRDPAACLPELINEEERATLIMYLSNTVSDRLEILHRRFDQGNNDMSLRTLLVRFLEVGECN